MKIKVKLFFVFVFSLSSSLYGQPLIPEDRAYLKVGDDVAKLEQDIYHPSFPGTEPTHFIRWVYEYAGGLLMAERAFLSSDLTRMDTEKLFEYNKEGKITSNHTRHASLPELNSLTTYEYNSEGRLIKVTQSNTISKEVYRLDTYQKYKDQTSYEQTSQFFGDDNKKTVKYTSVYKNGLKQSVIFKDGYPPVYYQYDTTGNLIARNARKLFYKQDERGNAIATVQLERGMRIYNFIRITYTDGTVTGSLEPDKVFIQEWDNRK